MSYKTPFDGKLWYLPHNGVYHPAKPNKTRVVFDCNAEYAGRSINKELLVGPDLTNWIIGTVIRFRQEKKAFVAGIEKMFFQVLVSKEHRSLLRFLWWQDYDLSKKLIEHDMYVHVFSGTSSPYFSNYMLKRTSIDKEDQFGKTAAEILQDTFCVDNLLKSLNNERKVIKIIKNIKEMCASERFKITNFFSNSKQVLQFINEAYRRTRTKTS